MRSSSGTGACETFAHGERAACVARAVERLREDRERVRARRRHEHVEGLGRRDAKFVDGDGMHVLAVGGDDGHRQARDPHVERGHRRAVDETQAHALAGTEQPRPVRRRRAAVHQVRVRRAADVGEVARPACACAPTRGARPARPRSRRASHRARSRRACASGSRSSPSGASAGGIDASGSRSVQSDSSTTCSRS